MMWLGRTEMYLIAPESADPPQTDADIQRQTIDAVLVSETTEAAGKDSLLQEIDSIIQIFTGESDNVTLPNIQSLIQETGLASANKLLDTLIWKNFQDAVAHKPYAFQRINSQILMSDPMSPDQIKPAASFLLLGQRFVIDSYITGNVVYDKIIYDNTKILRMLPSTLVPIVARTGVAQPLADACARLRRERGEFRDPAGQRHDVADREIARFVQIRLEVRRNVAGQDRRAELHGLEQRNGQPLVRGGQHENAGVEQ